jgi:arylsulfatase A-like enzyme
VDIVVIVKRFEEKGQLDNTYFVFTSDNGYRHGEHAMVHGKHTLRGGHERPALRARA